MTVFLRLDQVIALHRIAAGDHPLLDRATLESAVARSQAGFGGQDAHPTVFDKAAALLHGLAGTQCFRDGNKRVAWIATVTFLELNGHDLGDVPDIEAEAFVIAVAVDAWTDRTVQKAAEWFAHRVQIAPLQRAHPQLDYAMLARGAVAEDGVLHLVGGGIATIATSELPAATLLVAVCRIFWTPADEGQSHQVAAEVYRERDQELISGGGVDCTPPIRGGHTHVPHGLMPSMLALQLPLLLEEEGQHSVRLTLDGSPLTRLPVNVFLGGELV